MKDEQKYANIVDMVSDFNSDKNLILQLTQQLTDLESKLKESENFYKDLGFKDEKDARDYLIDCITQPKDLVEDVRKLKQKLANMTEKYNACQEARKLESEFSQQDKKELIQQLIEKDQAIESLQEINQSLGQTCNNDAKEIERLRESNNHLDRQLDYFTNKFRSRAFKRAGCWEKDVEIYMNKTAIAELEKAKEIVLKEVERVEEIYTDGFQSGFNCCYVFMKKQIDQQIAKLKGGK